MNERRSVVSAAGARFELRGQLGEGGTGVVYRAFDRSRGHEVALKTLRRHEGRDLFRFKREFRSLADLAHPNLVALHELQTVDADWMFSMELVDGVPFTSWVRPGGVLDEARLRAALGQLADGVLALHDAGTLHCDLKPSNVLVEAGGRVVILDFGLVADAARPELATDRLAAGTPAYMSPEQAADLPVGPASDWYSVGVILHEALTGRRPFEGAPAIVMAQKQEAAPPSPRTLDPAVPEDLDGLCRRLLDRDPARRPDGRAVLAALGRAPSPATERLGGPRTRAPFVGREAELAALRGAVADSRTRSGITVVIGASGIGKTSLIRRFVEEVGRDADVVVLEGRCYERESVPYKTLDGVIDGLAAHLVATEAPPARPALRDVAALLRLFPVLGRVPWLEVPTLPGAAPAEGAELRRRALAALRLLLGGLAARGPVILAIDDLQWGDVDGAAALAELMDAADTREAGFLVVATHRREDIADGAALAALRRLVPDRIRELELDALDDDDARDLWSRLSGDPAHDADAVRDAAGSPLLLGEIARARAAGAGRVITVEEAIQARVARLSDAAQALLRVISVAGRPLRLAIARRAAGLPAAEEALRALRPERLVRLRGTDPVVEARHDRIRSAVVVALAAEELRSIHRRLAEALFAEGDVSPEVLIDHWLGAGEGARASDLAEDAARRAEERLAFHRAADLLGLALVRPDLEDGVRLRLLARRGRALAAAGRLVEAAVELRAASVLASGRERLELDRLTTESLLKAGRLDEGMAAASALLAQVGESTPRLPTMSLLAHRGRLWLRRTHFTERAEADVDPDDLDRLDVLWSVASGLSFVEPILGLALHARLLRLALDAGEPRRTALALGQELGYVAMAGAPARHRVDQLHARGAALARRLGQPAIEGFVDVGGGVGTYLAGGFRAGLAALDAGIARMAEHPEGLRFQLDLAHIFRNAILWWLGELRELVRWNGEQVRAAELAGNVNARRHLSSWPGSAMWLVEDRPDESHDRIAASTPKPRAGERFHLHHYHALAGHTVVDLYKGDGAEAHRRLERYWSHIERARVLRVQIIDIEARFLRGRAALAVADLELARACARRIDHHGVAHASALAAALRAEIARARGADDAALSELRLALRHAEQAEIGLHAAAARWRLGRLVGGDEGAGMIGDAEQWFRDQAVVNPAAMLAIV